MWRARPTPKKWLDCGFQVECSRARKVSVFRESAVRIDRDAGGIESLAGADGLVPRERIPIHRLGLTLVALLGACGLWTLLSPGQEPAPAPPAIAADEQIPFDERFALPLPAIPEPQVLAFSDRFASAFPQTASSDQGSSVSDPLPVKKLADDQVAASGARVAARPAPVQRQTAVPLPAKRPATAVRSAKAQPASVASIASQEPPAEEPTIFERLFGKIGSGAMMAYAPADSAANVDDKPVSSSLYGSRTAVYDISARTVYLPNGTKLEAHSGLGEHMDHPGSAKLRMRGVTPPHIYDLTLRESLFHGVQAIRLNPVGGEDKIHGRVGLLAHSYMLGVRGDSNGCVSIKDYAAFLRAYQSGAIKRLVVVAKLSG
jgi:Protein of unknown function (DUF2778)